MAATISLLEERPLRDITIEAIAQQAGVGKATIYKWWPNKAYLALEAFLTCTEKHVEIPDTGSARIDFAIQVKSLMHFYMSRTGSIFCQFLVEGRQDPEFAEYLRKGFINARRAMVKEILFRGLSRGEIRGGLDSEIVIDLIYGPIFYRLLAGHAPLNDGEVDKLIDTLFDGLKS